MVAILVCFRRRISVCLPSDHLFGEMALRGRGGRGRGRGASKAASSGYSGAAGRGRGAVKAAVDNDVTGVRARAAHKLRENVRNLSEMERELVLDPATGLTLRQRIERDVADRDAGLPSNILTNTCMLEIYILCFKKNLVIYCVGSIASSGTANFKWGRATMQRFA